MSIYIYKNNQQTGPFEETKVLEMLKNGQLSPNDSAIRHGEKEWQNLGVYFPNAGKATPVEAAATVAAPSTPKKSRKGLLLGCGGFFIVSLLIAGVLGFLAFRNLYPSPNDDDVPETVKTTDSGEFKLKSRNRGNGNIWGTEKTFAGVYMNKDYPDDYEKSIILLVSVYADEKTAQETLEKELSKSCEKGKKPIRFSFVDGNMKELATSATCLYPLYVHKNNKLYSIGGPGVNVANWIAFAENLPFNQGSRMMGKPDVPIKPPQTFPDPNPEKKADFQVNANDFYKEALATENRESGNAKYKGKVVEISGRVFLFQAFDRKKLHFRTEESRWVDLALGASQADKLQNIKEDERVHAKCDVSVSYQIELMDCIILERKPAVMLDETPDITITAKEFYEQVENSAVSYDVRDKNRKKYKGKVIDITGEVYKLGDEKNYFRVGEKKFISCGNDKDSLRQFYFLKDGQQVIFRATYNGYSFENCILVRWF